MEMPQGYRKEGHVLKSNTCLYGLEQSPKNFFEYLQDILENIGMKTCEHELCIFVTSKVICLVYVDDCLFFAKKDSNITELLEQIKKHGLKHNVEEDAGEFLGVTVKRFGSKIQLLQTGLNNKIALALEIQDSKQAFTPAKKKCLGKDPDGEPAN
eukprot:15364571-Ditylum_brightwellii.AAC.1